MLTSKEKEMISVRESRADEFRVLRAIELLRNAHPDMLRLFMEGRCYAFARFLSAMVDDECEIHYSRKEGHVYLFWKDAWWDIRGAHRTVPADTARLYDDGDPCFLWDAGDTRRLLGPNEAHPLANSIGSPPKNIG